MERTSPTQALLVPLDGSPLADHALPYATAIAAPGGRLVLFRVLGGDGGVDEVLDRLGARDASADQTAAMEALSASAKLVGEGFNVQLATASGDAAETILAAIGAQGVGAVVIASHGRGAVGRWMFGSVADRLARTSPVPVVIVRPAEPEAAPAPVSLTRLVVPLDGSEVAMQALPVAVGVARAHGLPIHLITAIDLAGMVPMAIPAGPAMPMSGELYDQVYEEIRAGAAASLKEAAARVSAESVPVTTEVRIGPPSVAVTDIVGAGDLIVLSSHGRTGVQRWLLGSVAEQLVRGAPVPVMLVPVVQREAVAAGGAV